MQLFAHSSLLIAAPPPPNGCKLLAFRIERSTLFLFSVFSYLSLYLSLLTTVFARSCFLSSIDRIFFVCLFFHNNIISNNRNNYFRIPSVCVFCMCVGVYVLVDFWIFVVYLNFVSIARHDQYDGGGVNLRA